MFCFLLLPLTPSKHLLFDIVIAAFVNTGSCYVALASLKFTMETQTAPEH